MAMDHPSQRNARLEAARKVAAMAALRVEGERELVGESLFDFADSAELTTGYQSVVEQLAIELGRETGRSASEVLSQLAAQCAGALEHPPAG